MTTSLNNNLPDTYEFQLDPVKINIDVSYFATLIGYTPENIPELVKSAIVNILSEKNKYLDIKFGFKILPGNKLKFEKSKIHYGDVEFNSEKIITGRLKGAEALVIFTATAGKGITEWSHELTTNNDYLEAYLVDTLGSEIVENTADIMEVELKKVVEPLGFKISNRYSPGYCDWHVSEQKKLFSLLPENFCGISLTSSSLMIPIKSVSGIIGIGKDMKREEYNCSICEMENCLRRNHKQVLSK